jgi:hypothetical protein
MTTLPELGGTTPRLSGRRTRQTLSCAPCRMRKSKCDRQAPCSGCRARKTLHLCNYAMRGHSVNGSSYIRRGGEGEDEDASTDASTNNCQLQTSDMEGPLTAGTCSSRDSLPGSPPCGFGALNLYDNMSIKYKARQSHWSSVLPSSVGATIASPRFSSQVENTGNSGPLLSLLPGKQHCDHLISRFFDVFSPILHLLHDPTFHSEYARFSQQPQSAQLSWLAMLFAMLSLAVMTLDDDDSILNDLGREGDGPSNVRAVAAQYKEAAMKCLEADQYMVQHRLTTLQCLIFLIYAINHSEGSGSSWALLGMWCDPNAPVSNPETH